MPMRRVAEDRNSLRWDNGRVPAPGGEAVEGRVQAGVRPSWALMRSAASESA
jgi:hypothetical protein